jgi:two-component system sensor histidine kinase UhpB
MSLYAMRWRAQRLFSSMLGITLTATSPVLFAQQTPQATHELDEIVVVGITPVPGFKVDRDKIPGNIQTLRSSDLTRPREQLQLDEVPGVLLVIAIALIWFSLRRYFEAIRQLRLRRTVEARLAEALAENQRLAQQYVDKQEYERKALARDLHDELGQYLNAIKLDAVSIREATLGHSVVHTVARAMIANIDRVYGVVTGLIQQLRPVGFEALTNIARHAHATRVQIRIAAGQAADSEECIEVLIADNGAGADMSKPRAGLGLVGMRERVSALGGSITLLSERGAGFSVKARLPMAGAQA